MCADGRGKEGDEEEGRCLGGGVLVIGVTESSCASILI